MIVFFLSDQISQQPTHTEKKSGEIPVITGIIHVKVSAYSFDLY